MRNNQIAKPRQFLKKKSQTEGPGINRSAFIHRFSCLEALLKMRELPEFYDNA